MHEVCVWEGRIGDPDGVLGAGRGDCDVLISLSIIGLSFPLLILAHSSIEDGCRNTQHLHLWYFVEFREVLLTLLLRGGHIVPPPPLWNIALNQVIWGPGPPKLIDFS